jgi:hypothetical protein
MGRLLGLDLVVDKRGLVAISLHGMKVQIQMDQTLEKVILGSFLGGLGPGRFREEVLKEGLKWNGRRDGGLETLAYVEEVGQLFIFVMLPFENISAEFLVALLPPFVQAGEGWKRSIAEGRISPPRDV